MIDHKFWVGKQLILISLRNVLQCNKKYIFSYGQGVRAIHHACKYYMFDLKEKTSWKIM